MSDLGLVGGARGAGAGLVAAPRGRSRSRGREGSVPFSGAGRPAPGPLELGKGWRCRRPGVMGGPAGAGLPGLPGVVEASLSSPGPRGNRYRHCWSIPWENLLILWCVRGGKGFFLFSIDSVVAALSRGTQYRSLRTILRLHSSRGLCLELRHCHYCLGRCCSWMGHRWSKMYEK